MKKIKTLFERVIVDHEIIDILPNVAEGCEWVLKGEGIATRKFDGTACMIKDGKLYARLDYYAINRWGRKKQRVLPEGAIPCQPESDPITGHFPHWVPVTGQHIYKWHKVAFESQPGLEDGTYELCGVHIKSNPEHIAEGDILIKHGSVILDVPRTFEGIRQFLEEHDIEGIVFHRENGDMCKIKRTDFHFMWNGSYSSR